MFPLKVCRIVLNKTNVAGKIKYVSGYLTISNSREKNSVSLSLNEAKLLAYFSTSIEVEPSDFSSSEDSQLHPTSPGEFHVHKCSSNMEETLGYGNIDMFFYVYYFTLRNIPEKYNLLITFFRLQKLYVPRMENRMDIKSLKIKSHFKCTRGN